MIRRATVLDVSQIADLAVKAVTRNRTFTPKRSRIERILLDLVMDDDSFCWVSDSGGKVSGCVAAETVPLFWANGTQSTVLMFYCEEGGEGGKLLLRYARWLEEKGVDLAVFSLEDNDERLARSLCAVAKRVGLASEAVQQVNWTRHS